MCQQNQGVAALASGEIWGYGLFKGPKTQSASGWSALCAVQRYDFFRGR